MIFWRSTRSESSKISKTSNIFQGFHSDETRILSSTKSECLSILVREEDDYSKEPAMEERTKKKRNSERAKHYEQGVE